MIKFFQNIYITVSDMFKRSRIPRGMYCYKNISDPAHGYPIQKMCPYWSMRSDKPSQDNGYCSYLKMGDWEDEDHIGLLWDQVKECGIKDEPTMGDEHGV